MKKVGGAAARSLLVASLAMASAALLAPHPASAQVGEFRLGVQAVTGDSPDMPAMARAKARTVRLFFRWSEIEVARRTGARCNASYNWSNYDRNVLAAGRNGIRVLPTISASPSYVAGSGAPPPHTSSPAIEDYKCFVRALVRRYGRGGSFIRKPANRGALPITAWQIWNEPNLAHFSPNGKPDPKQYARLVKISRQQILAVDRRANIILAGMPAASLGFSFEKFVRQLYQVRGFRNKFDVVAVHPYASGHKGVEGALVRLRRLLKSVNDARRPVWITEMGWGTHGRNYPWFVKSEAGQATELRRTFRMLKRNRKRFKLGTVTWFRWQDTSSYASNSPAFSYAGLYRYNGTTKPACSAFVRFTGGRCSRIARGTSVSGLSSSSLGTDSRAELLPSPPE